MDLAQIIRSRRTVHSYKPEKISDEMVKAAFELALWAPNHKLTYPCRFYSVEGKTREAIADLSVDLKAAKKNLSDAEKKATRENLLNPSHLVILGLRRDPDARRMHEDYATLACGVQIASLYLCDLGIGTKWSTGGATTHERTYEILGLSREDVQLEGALMIGVPLAVPAIPKRPPIENCFMKK